MKKTKKIYLAFTLIELMVVISILAILSTIWIVNYLKYLRDWRDSQRVNTMSNIEQVLEIELTNNWFYPEPDNSKEISFSWDLLWTQWTFWNVIFDSIQKLEKKPVDPLTWDEYAYSITNIWDQYQIWSIQEVDQELTVFDNLINKTYADSSSQFTALVFWNYNKKIISTNINSLSDTWYILAIPSILSTMPSPIDIESIISYKNLVYPWYKNIPSNFSSNYVDRNWWFDFYPNNINDLIVFSWSYELLKNDQSERILLLKNIQEAYSWSLIEDDLWNIINIDIDLWNPSIEVKELSNMIIEEYLNKTIIK